MFSRRFLESLTIALPDGRFRVRPRGRWARSYIVDRSARDSLVRFQQIFGWIGFAAIVFATVLPRHWSAGAAIVGTAACATVLGLLWEIGTRLILRRAASLPRGPDRSDSAIIEAQQRAVRSGRMHLWLYRPLIAVCIASAAFFALVCVGVALTGDTPSIALLTAPLFFALLATLVRLAHRAR